MRGLLWLTILGYDSSSHRHIKGNTGGSSLPVINNMAQDTWSYCMFCQNQRVK